MTRSLLALVLLGLMTQHPVPYPEGAVCTPHGTVVAGVVVAPEHPCHCRRMDVDSSCEGPPQEDPVCLQFCSKQNCACPVFCVTPAPSEDEG